MYVLEAFQKPLVLYLQVTLFSWIVIAQCDLLVQWTHVSCLQHRLTMADIADPFPGAVAI